MISKKFPALNILLIVAMLLSFTAIAMPTTPAKADASPVVTSATAPNPAGGGTSSNPAFIKPGGTVTVNFAMQSTDNATYSCTAYVVQGSTVYNSAPTSIADNGAIKSLTVATSTAAPTGYYYVYVNVGGTMSAQVANAVYVDNVAPILSIIAPNSSTCWGTGTQTISWTTSDVADATKHVWINASLSTNGGVSFTPIITNQEFAQGIQSSTYSFSAAGACVLQMTATDAAGNVCTAVTSPVFYVIAAGTISGSITTPAGSETWTGSSSQTLAATVSAGGSAINYMFVLSRDGTTTNTENITSGWQSKALVVGPNSITFPWTVANDVVSSNCKILLYLKDCAGNIYLTTSNPFSITTTSRPTVTVTSPLSGTKWYAGSADNITWTVTDTITSAHTHTLYYTSDNTTNINSWTPISCSVQNVGTNYWATWNVPLGLSGTYYIQIRSQTSGGQMGYGFSYGFTLISDTIAPTVSLSAPTGGDSWQGGTSHYITWACVDQPDSTARLTYKFYLLYNGAVQNYTSSADGSFATLSNQAQTPSGSTSSFSWAVPDPSSLTPVNGPYKVRIVAIDPAGNQAWSDSPATFTITNLDCAVMSESITLYKGWNLISLQIIPTNTNVDNFFSSIQPDILGVRYYSGGGSGTTYYYTPGNPAGTNNLTTIEAGKAYWVQMKTTQDSYTLTYQGRKCPCPPSAPMTIPIATSGWYMVGFKSTTTQTISAYLNGMAYLTTIFGFNGATQEWEQLDGNTGSFTAGKGYWVSFFNSGPITPGCK